MKTISLRAFRDSMPTEPVVVAVRRGGELVTLGTWTPIGEIPTLKMAEFAARTYDVPLRTITSPEERDRLARGQPIREPMPDFGNDILAGRPFTPVPKPGKRG